MVQLYRHTAGPDGPNRYWKFNTGTALTVSSLRKHLSDASFTTRKETRTFRLIELYVRCQRSLVSYEEMDLPKLQLCVSQRGLSIPAEKHTPSSSKPY